LLHALNQAQQKVEEFKKELEETYGKINIDIKDGSFEPIEEKEEAALVDEYIR